MPFQSSVNTAQGYSVPGDIAFNGPTRAATYTLVSASAAYNIVGATAFTVTSEGVAAAGGTGVFAGILIAPKSYASYGTTGDTLAPSMLVPNNAPAELLTMGQIVVYLPGAAAIGDPIKYNTTTGALGTGAPGAGEAAVPNAKVTNFTVSGAGLAVITLTN